MRLKHPLGDERRRAARRAERNVEAFQVPQRLSPHVRREQQVHRVQIDHRQAAKLIERLRRLLELARIGQIGDISDRNADVRLSLSSNR